MADTTSAAWSLLFGVRRSVRYHMRRQRFFDRLDRATALASLMAGSSTVVALLASAGEGLVLAAAAATAVAGACAAVSCRAVAPAAQRPRREFTGLERDVVGTAGDLTPERLAELTDRRLAIEAGGPPILRVLDALCHNELLTAVGGSDNQRATITRLQHWLANWTDFRADRLRKRAAV